MRIDAETGYLTDIPYTAGVYVELAPVHLDYVLAVRGYEPVSLQGPFKYCELGCGRGFTTNVLAAANPEAEFHGIDMMPAHISEATRLARRGGLGNVRFHEATFADACKMDMPQFDIIVLHGIYSWASESARNDIVEFLRRRLKPGGIAYNSYNAMPGWAPVIPLRNLLVERAASLPGDGAENAGIAMEWVKGLFALDGFYTKANPRIKQFLDGLVGKPLNYIAHEYLHAQWQPFWFTEVRNDMARARISYVGDAVLSGNYPEHTLPKPWVEFMKQTGKAVDWETQKDFLLNTQFRKDVYAKGASQIDAAQRLTLFREFIFAARAAVIGDEITLATLKLATGPLHRAIFAAAQADDFTVPALERLAQSEKVNFGTAMGALQVLVAANLLQPMARPSQPGWKQPPAARLVLSPFNQALLDQAVNARQAVWLASSVSGNAVALTAIEAVVMSTVLADPEAGPEKLHSELQRRNLNLSSEGKPVTESDKLNQLLTQHLTSYRSTALPTLRRLGVLMPQTAAAARVPRIEAAR